MSDSSKARRPPGLSGVVGVIVATLVGNLFLVVGTVVMSVVALLLCWIPPRGRMIFRCARFWSRGVLWFSGARLESSVEAPLAADSTYVLMANHQSLLDIPALLASVPLETRFMAKRSLFRIPLFGWVLRVGGFVSVDRRDQERSRGGFQRALEELRSGASLLVFPEGTRSADGRLLPFKRGGLLLALKSGLPIVPVGIHGTRAMRPRGSFGFRPGTARVRYGRPMAPADYGVRGLRELESDLRARIAELADLGPEDR